MGDVKLLVVEDDPLFGGALNEVLTGAGYQVRLAVTGADALAAAAGESFDLVVQDILVEEQDIITEMSMLV